MESQTVGENNEDSYDRFNIFNKAVGKCPEVEVLMEGQPIRCLIDTGSQVSTVTETFFRQLLKATVVRCNKIVTSKRCQ